MGALIDVISLSLCNSSCEIALRSMTNRKISIENETGAGKIVDLDILTPDLVRTYQRGPADGQRLLALQALINIGNMSALEQIANAKGQQSKAVQDATNKSLIAFYLGKYPELEGRTNRRSVLSISEVQRAESVRLKMTKRAGRN